MQLRLLLATPLIVALLACGDDPQGRCGEPPSDTFTFLGASPPYEHPHDRWLELNDEIPSFAGYYLDGGPHVLLVKGAPQEDITRARQWAGGGAVVLTTANFTFRELHGYWDAGRDVAFLSVPSGRFYSYDLDEKHNVVRAEVATEADVELASAAWEEAGFPPSAFVAEVGEPFCFLSK